MRRHCRLDHTATAPAASRGNDDLGRQATERVRVAASEGGFPIPLPAKPHFAAQYFVRDVAAIARGAQHAESTKVRGKRSRFFVGGAVLAEVDADVVGASPAKGGAQAAVAPEARPEGVLHDEGDACVEAGSNEADGNIEELERDSFLAWVLRSAELRDTPLSAGRSEPHTLGAPRANPPQEHVEQSSLPHVKAVGEVDRRRDARSEGGDCAGHTGDAGKDFKKESVGGAAASMLPCDSAASEQVVDASACDSVPSPDFPSVCEP